MMKGIYASAALESVGVEGSCVKYLRLRRKDVLERENGRRVAIPFMCMTCMDGVRRHSTLIHRQGGIWLLSKALLPCKFGLDRQCIAWCTILHNLRR